DFFGGLGDFLGGNFQFEFPTATCVRHASSPLSFALSQPVFCGRQKHTHVFVQLIPRILRKFHGLRLRNPAESLPVTTNNKYRGGPRRGQRRRETRDRNSSLKSPAARCMVTALPKVASHIHGPSHTSGKLIERAK